MIDLLLDTEVHDLVVTNGDLTLADNDVAIRQNVLQRINFFLGEWFLDTTQGVPYFQYILVKSPDLDLITGLLTGVVKDTPGILEVQSVNVEFTSGNRTLTVGIQAQSTSGAVNITTTQGV